MIKFLVFIMVLCGGYVFVSRRLKVPLVHYAKRTPSLDPWKFFKGKLNAVGIILDPFGRVLQSFEIDVYGEFTKASGVMRQNFMHADVIVAKRTWTFARVSTHHFEGCAPDVIGKMRGEWRGNAIAMHYKLRIPLFGRERVVDVEDFLYAVNAHTVQNIAVFRKWGIPIARLYINFRK